MPIPEGPGVEKKYYCDQCEKHFQESSSVKRHMLVHSNVKPFTCEQCRKSFSQKCHLKKHKCRKHNCILCEKVFKNKIHLERHLFVHSNEKGFRCDQCGKTFKQRGHLSRHKKEKGHFGNPPHHQEDMEEVSSEQDVTKKLPDPIFELLDQLKRRIENLNSLKS